MLKRAGNQWSILALVLSVALMASGCGLFPKTAKGKAQKAGQIMIAMDEVMLTECEKSKAGAVLNETTGEMEWQPLSKETCKAAKLAYMGAFASWEATLDELAQDPNASIGSHLTVITRYILIVADIFKEANIKLPDNIQDHVDTIKGVLLK